MPPVFLYDTHYQVDKPLALLDLTLRTTSPTKSVTDQALASLLAKRAKSRPAVYDRHPIPWEINPDAMTYWLAICHDTGILSRQNAYDYWLMNFVWNESFDEHLDAWGTLRLSQRKRSQMLLFRWAWLHDAPMLVAVLWYLATHGPSSVGSLIAPESTAVEQMTVSAFNAIRDTSADVMHRTSLRRQMEAAKRGFKYNTRRHKLETHLGLLVDSEIVIKTTKDYSLSRELTRVFQKFHSMADAVQKSVTGDELGTGTEFFLEIVREVFGVNPRVATGFSEENWKSVQPELSHFWKTVVTWDRKFLGIRELAEYFLVRNLASGTEIWPPKTWEPFLLNRARYQPEEVTVHVGRFGEVRFLRLAHD
jgi:hypothetical protein